MENFELRPYQREALDKLDADLQKNSLFYLSPLPAPGKPSLSAG